MGDGVNKGNRANEGDRGSKGDRGNRSAVLGNLDKATPIELFFDLVFIVCMRSITPVLSQGEGAIVEWYAVYIFVFCFVLMMQVWFSSTMLMNRCGTGGARDVWCLLVNMFLLFMMTRIISLGWEHYVAFNVMWILLNVNMIIHWALRLRDMPPDVVAENKHFILRIIAAHAVSSVLVLLSFLLPSVPAQVVCLLALLVGWTCWPRGRALSEAGREHLAERCALFLILAFGETLVGLSGAVSDLVESSGMFSAVFVAVMYFMLIAGMFLVYLVHVEKKLDPSKLGSGTHYMMISMLLVFCVMCITATLELDLEGKTLFFMGNDDFFSVMATVFLLSFFLFKPFVKPPVRKGLGWIVVRIIASMLPLLVVLVEHLVLASLLDPNEDGLQLILAVLAAVMSLIAFTLGSFMVLVVDYKMYTPKKPRKRAKGQAEGPEEVQVKDICQPN